MRLNTKGARAPIEIALPEGGVLILKPWATAAQVAASTAFGKVLAGGGSRADADVAFTAAAAAWAATSWSGVFEAGDDDEAEDAELVPLDMTEDLVVLMVTTEPSVFGEIDRRYVDPGLQREAEKNGSAPSRSGVTPAGALTDNQVSPGVASPTARPAASPVTTAPAAPTRSRRPKPAPSGT